MKAIVWAALAFVTATGAVSQSSPSDRANPVNNGKPIEWRSHFEAVDKASGTAYLFTEITQLPDESEDRIYTLVEDTASHDRLVVKQRMNYMDHEASVEITDLDTHETASATSPLPYVSITRSGALDEIHKNPALRSWRVPSITLSVNGVAQTASETEWLSNVTRDKRSTVRRPRHRKIAPSTPHSSSVARNRVNSVSQRRKNRAKRSTATDESSPRNENVS